MLIENRLIAYTLLALLLLAALFCVPSLVLTDSEWLPEVTGAVENYVPFWKGLLRFLIFCAWCWVWALSR